MKLPTRSFASGFATATALAALIWIYQGLQFWGGYVEDSPSGRFSVRVFGPQQPSEGGTYVVEVHEKATGDLLRRVELTVRDNEKTVTLRGGHADTEWNSAETEVDVTVDGGMLVSVALPSA